MVKVKETQRPVVKIRPARPARLRLLMTAVRFYPFMGGLETHTYEVARRLAAQDVDVTVLTLNPGGKLAPREKVEGIQVRRVRSWPAERDFAIAPELYRVITQENWSVLHCQGYHTFVPPLAMAAARRAGLPYVVSFHSGGHSSRLRNAIRATQWRGLRPLFNGAERLVAVSRFEADHFSRNLSIDRNRFVVIPNGSQLPALTEPAPALEPGEKLILSVGRLEKYKGHHRVLEALPLVLQRYPGARLHIVGAGPYEGELRRQAEALGVTEQVQIAPIPAEDRQGMARRMAQASLITLLSEYEAHPIAVTEALSMQRPVLVADTSGLHEFAERGQATAVAFNSSREEVAAAIVQQLDQPLLAGAVRLPTWEDCTSELLTLYSTITKES